MKTCDANPSFNPSFFSVGLTEPQYVRHAVRRLAAGLLAGTSVLALALSHTSTAHAQTYPPPYPTYTTRPTQQGLATGLTYYNTYFNSNINVNDVSGDRVTIQTTRDGSGAGNSLTNNATGIYTSGPQMTFGNQLTVTTQGLDSDAIRTNGNNTTNFPVVKIGNNLTVDTYGVSADGINVGTIGTPQSGTGLVIVGDNAVITTHYSGAIPFLKEGAHGVRVNTAASGGAQNIYIGNNSQITTMGSSSHAAYATGAANSNIYFLDGSTLKTQGTSSYAAYTSGAAATINFGTDTTFTTQGTNSHGAYAYGSSSTIAFNGEASITTQGTGAYGAYARGKIQFADATINTFGANAYGVYATSATGRVEFSGTATIRTQLDNAHGVVAYGGGTVVMQNATVETQGPGASAIYMNGTTVGQTNTISATGGTFTSANGAAIGTKGAVNVLSLSAANVSGNGLLLDVTAYSAVVSSVLNLTGTDLTLTGGARVADSSTSNLVLERTTWTLTPAADATVDSGVTNLTLTNSTMVFAEPATDTFQTLTVRDDYAATNAILVLNTRLDAGGALSAQATDRLLIAGNVTGTTMVTVKPTATSVPALTSAGGANLASEGISLIQVGGTAAADSFQLAGSYVAMAGKPYQYRLYAYGPGATMGPADVDQRLVAGSDPHWDYRLQSVAVIPPEPPCEETGTCPPTPPGPTPPAPTPPVPSLVPQGGSYLTAPNALFQAGLMDMANLHRRLGEIRDSRTLGADTGTGEAWLRGYGGSFNYTSNRSASAYGFDADIDYAAVQLGGNLFSHRTDNGTTRVGLAASFGSLNFSPNQRDASEGKTDTYTLAGYATYQADRGWYVDGALSFGLFNGEVSSDLRGKTAGLSGSSFGASIEAGRPFALGSSRWSLEPQVQLMFQHLSFDTKRDIDGFSVDFGSQNQLTGRLGLRLARGFRLEGGDLLTPYARVNVLHGFLDGGDVYLGGDAFHTGNFGTSLELAAGATATLTQKLSLYGELGWQTSIADAGMQGWAATAGLRYGF